MKVGIDSKHLEQTR